MDGYLKDKHVSDVYLRIHEVSKTNKYRSSPRSNAIDDDILKNNVDRLHLSTNFTRRSNATTIRSRIKYH